jgi:hypothetical protein
MTTKDGMTESSYPTNRRWSDAYPLRTAMRSSNTYPPRTTAEVQARGMVLLGASAIARNVSWDLVFAAIGRAASSHADLDVCTDGAADAQSRAADRTTSFWHARASVWIATSFRPCPRMHEYANAWWLLQLHAICALQTDDWRVCLLLQYLIQSCARVGRRIVEDMCYEIRRAEACVD